MEDRKIWVYDIETLASVFTYTAYNIDTKEIVKFVIHSSRNDIIEMVEHILSCNGMVGFNNLSFDYPVIHYILLNWKKWLENLKSNEEIIALIYKKVQDIINGQIENKFGSIIRTKEVLVPQLDLFRMWHFNNKARSTSLKALEISMNYPNVMDMPIDHARTDIREDEIEGILEYNENDVLATEKFYQLSEGKIGLRKGLEVKYGLPCINYPDSKIGEELVLKLYCDATGLNPWEVKKLRTERESIDLGECIFDYIEFKTSLFNQLLTKLKSKTITQTKGSIEESVIYKGFKYDYGTGGIHGCIKPGVYISDDKYMIIDADVASLYPSIAIVNRLFPEHLGEIFCDVYENGIVKPRLEAKKAGDMIMANGFKLSANSVYGKSNDKYSFLYDPKYTLQTTLNGQFMLTMLCEDLVEAIKDLQMLQVNTDGITMRILRSDYQKYLDICAVWEKKVRLTLEYVEYDKMIIRDVNNYMAVTTKGKVKYKGAFEIEKELHKDNSFKIVPIAISEYFTKGIPVEQTIRNHKNIYDFCGRQKFIGQDYGVTHTLDYMKNGNAYDRVDKQQKNVRYYITSKGSTFVKHYSSGGEEVINRGYQAKVFNKFEDKEDFKDYSINYEFYIKEANKEINNIVDKQLELF